MNRSFAPLQVRKCWKEFQTFGRTLALVVHCTGDAADSSFPRVHSSVGPSRMTQKTYLSELKMRTKQGLLHWVTELRFDKS